MKCAIPVFTSVFSNGVFKSQLYSGLLMKRFRPLALATSFGLLQLVTAKSAVADFTITNQYFVVNLEADLGNLNDPKHPILYTTQGNEYIYNQPTYYNSSSGGGKYYLPGYTDLDFAYATLNSSAAINGTQTSLQIGGTFSLQQELSASASALAAYITQVIPGYGALNIPPAGSFGYGAMASISAFTYITPDVAKRVTTVTTSNNMTTTTYGVAKAGQNYVAASSASVNSTYLNLASQSSFSQANAAKTTVTLSPLPRLIYLSIDVNWASTFTGNSADPKASAQLFSTAIQQNAPNLAATLTPVDVSPTASSADNKATIQNAINALGSQVKSDSANGLTDSVIIYISSHGVIDEGTGPLAGQSELLLSQQDTLNGINYAPGLHASEFGSMLAQAIPASTQRVVFIDACHAGNFGVSIGPNSGVLSATTDNKDGTDAEDGADAKGIGIFTDAIVSDLNHGVTNLNTLQQDAKAYTGGLVGQTVPLFDLPGSTGTFEGLTPTLETSADFDGDVLGSLAVTPEPSSLLLLAPIFFFASSRRRRVS